jgi:hypothetical protein
MRAGVRAFVASALVPALLVLPAVAGAATPTGNTTLVVSAGKARVLAERGISFAGVRGAVTEGRETRLQISGGTVGADAASLSHDGALRLVAGEGKRRRVIRLARPQTQLGPTSTLTALLLGKRRVVFDLVARPGSLALDGLRGTASLQNARLVWRRGTAAAIGRWLGVALPKGALGSARASAAATGTETPKSETIADEPPLLARPASAVSLTGATVTWHVRDSWVRYVSTQFDPVAEEGAIPAAPILDSQHPCPDRADEDGTKRVYSFGFPFAGGWYDPPTGTTAIYTSGAVHYRYPHSGIDLATRNPEIEINGAASRVIVRLRGAEGTAYPDSRTAMLNLALAGPPTEGPAGTFAYASPIRAALDPNGQSIFAGFYPPPNNGFGCFSVSFSTG